MKIRFANLRFIYQFLEEPVVPRGEVEVWKGEDVNLEKLKRISGVLIQSATLPKPLSKVGGFFKKNDQNYHALIWIEPKYPDTFDGLSYELDGKINKAGELWVPTSKNATGYIMYKGEPRSSIVLSSSDSISDRAICIGTAGANPRRFSEDELTKGAQELEERVTTFVNLCIPENMRNSDFPIYLSPA